MKCSYCNQEHGKYCPERAFHWKLGTAEGKFWGKIKAGLGLRKRHKLD